VPLPIVVDLPPFIVPTDEITLELLEKGTVTTPANLPEACQVLYNNVSGKNICLDDKYFPEFTKAIQYSCETPGCFAYEKLKSKAGEFGDENLNETYLRITIGVNQARPSLPLKQWKNNLMTGIGKFSGCAIRA
jgi:hypothetical protein